MEELLKQLIRDVNSVSNEVKSLKFEMHDRFNELKNTSDAHTSHRKHKIFKSQI